MVKLAQPTFVAGPQDELATADVYTQTTSQVINSIQRLANTGDIDLSSGLRGSAALGALLAEKMPVIGGVSNGLLAVNKDNLIARLAVGSSSVVSSLRGMDTSLVNKIGGGIPANAEVFATVGTITQRVSASNLVDLASVGRMVSELSCNNTVFSVEDTGAQIGLWSGLIKEALRFRIPNVFGSLMSCVDNPRVLTEVAVQVMPSIISNSDLASLASVAVALSGGRARMVYPNAVPEFGRVYRHPSGASVPNKQEDWVVLDPTFGEIDPKWNRCDRSDYESVISTHNVQEGSPDFHELVTLNALKPDTPVEDKLLVFGAAFKPTNVDEQLRRHFPYTVTGPEQRQRGQVVDPRAYGFDPSLAA